MKKLSLLLVLALLLSFAAYAESVNYSKYAAIANEDLLPGTWIRDTKSLNKSTTLPSQFTWPSKDMMVFCDLSGAVKLAILVKDYVMGDADVYFSPDGNTLMLHYANDIAVYRRGY